MVKLRFLNGGGEMGRRMRDHDWSRTSLGSPSGWPQSLKTLVAVMMAAKQPMYVAWGPECLMLYNDSYVALLGDKHPSAFVRPFKEVWAEVWDTLEGLVDQVFTGEPVHMDDITLFVHRNGRTEEAHFAFSYNSIFDEDGSVAGLFCPCSETTQQILAERGLAAAKDAAEEANLAKSTFIANMSHELRTPLSAIIGYSEMLVEEIEDGAAAADLAEDMRKIEGNARHLLGLINDVLDLSKIESGKMEVFPERFEIGAMVQDVAATVQGLLAKKGNRLTLELPEKLGSMLSDVTKIRQMLLNLLSNAAKFTEQGRIVLEAFRSVGGDGRNMITFKVRDSGIGMTPEQLAILFQRFQQADASTTRRFGGTGLGLSITKAFSSMLGGDVGVVSEHGVGSTFTITLPADLPSGADDEPDEVVPIPDAKTSSGETVSLRDIVLVIDDDAAQRDLMSRFLEREGFHPRTAADGMAGLELARRLKPRAILLDVMMPGMDGWSVLTALKTDPDLATIPVVMVTFVSERGLATSLGAVDYVVKPVKWERFRQVMDRFRDAVGDVLVVDDDPDTRGQIRKALERDNWTVAEAGNGREALDVVAHAMPRVVLLDLIMPVMDGFAFLDALRARPGCEDLPVIVLSARDLTREDRKRLSEAHQVLNKAETSFRALAKDLRVLTAGPSDEAAGLG